MPEFAGIPSERPIQGCSTGEQVPVGSSLDTLPLATCPTSRPAARHVPPRVGHLHITVDDLQWLWADFGQSNTIIELVDAEGNVFTAQRVTFQSPGKEARP